MYELKKHKKSDKIKWVFTGIAFLLIAVMLVGFGLQLFGTGKQKPSEWFGKTDIRVPPVDEKPIKIVVENFEFKNTTTEPFVVFFFADTLASIENQIEENGYCDIEMELRGIDSKVELSWEWVASDLTSDVSDCFVVMVDANDNTKALLRFKNINVFDDAEYFVYLGVSNSSGYSMFTFSFISIESLGVIVI